MGITGFPSGYNEWDRSLIVAERAGPGSGLAYSLARGQRV
jgi:hypothetical protein